MKTLLVLSALASVTLAAPTLQEDDVEDIHHVPNWRIQKDPGILEHLKRDKKSTTDQSTGAITLTGTPNNDDQNDAGTSLHTGRTALKKPLIVKKKFGYRVYRDSEEEKANADSQETCGRQVKVKLCDEDGKFREMLRSSGHDVSNVHTSADDMKLSIQMAKEAVENLQRDLLKMEHKNTAMKMAHDSESDSDLHEDIEVARQALEHIHTNFGDLETMSLHATASKDSEAIHDVHITMAKSEEEKMAQWKEAMENIQKNVEIARNIEDSFKTANNQDNLLHSDQSDAASTQTEEKLENTASHVASDEGHHTRGAETTQLNIQTETEKEHNEGSLTDKATKEHLATDNAREEHHLEDDMHPSASEAIEMKAIDIDNHHILRSENHEHHEDETITQVKLDKPETDIHNTELHAAAPTDTSSLIEPQPIFIIKEAGEETEKNLDNKHNLFKTSEDEANNHKISSKESISTLTTHPAGEHQRDTTEIMIDDKLEHHKMHEITSEDSENLFDLQAKSVTPIDDDKKEHIHKETNLNSETDKSAEKSEPELENLHVEPSEIKPKVADPPTNIENKDSTIKINKSVPQIHKLNNAVDSLQVENSMRVADLKLEDKSKHQKIDYNESDPDHVASLNEMKSAENIFQLQLPMSKSAEHHFHHHLPTMKAAETHFNHHIAAMDSDENQLSHIEALHMNKNWAQEQRHLVAKEATEDFHRKNLNGLEHTNMRNSHYDEHHFAHHAAGAAHDFEASQHSHHHFHNPSRYHHHKMHDISGIPDGVHPSKFHPSMREAMDGFASEHMYRWAPTHEYRNAYGPSIASSSGGAVGVFPNANTGGCGIPLLLSCSPSVVSGSLAKAHPAAQVPYSSPSYRSDDDFTFHNKRDIKKTNEMRSTNVLRTPTIVKQKTLMENQL